jgi:hypothetical protein
MIQHHSSTVRATLVIGVGGFGGLVARQLSGLLTGEPPAHATRVCVVDTDEADITRATGAGISAHLVSARGPNRVFGDNRTSNIIQFRGRYGDHAKYLDALNLTDMVQLESGACTIPPIGDFLFEVGKAPLREFLTAQSLEIGRDARIVHPILVGSAGGGTSAPGLLRVARCLGEATERNRLLGGSAEAWRKPDIWFMPPVIQARAQKTRTFQLRPMSNAFAFTKEADLLSHERVIGNLFRFSPANGHGGLANTLEEAAAMLADSIFMHVHCPVMESRFADTFRVVSNEPGRRGTLGAVNQLGGAQ